MQIVSAVVYVVQSEASLLNAIVEQSDATKLKATITQLEKDRTISNVVSVLEAVADEFHGGQKTVSVPGTRELIDSDTSCTAVVVKALVSNVGIVYVGDTDLSQNQFELSSKEAIALGVGNLNKVYVDADNAGEGVCYVYVV